MHFRRERLRLLYAHLTGATHRRSFADRMAAVPEVGHYLLMQLWAKFALRPQCSTLRYRFAF